jgi:hypothetical protein
MSWNIGSWLMSSGNNTANQTDMKVGLPTF